MTVLSNVAGIVTGTGITTGNVEFWPSNYNQSNGRAAANGGPVPNASATAYDFGDGNAGTTAGHGSMQIHNYDLDGAGTGTAGQTLFSYAAWGASRVSEMGIGNNPNTAQAPDYTVTANLDKLLDKYTEHGTAQFVLPDALEVPPINSHGNVIEIAGHFGGETALVEAVNTLQALLYAA